jgi:hypothetical protein
MTRAARETAILPLHLLGAQDIGRLAHDGKNLNEPFFHSWMVYSASMLT